MTRAEAKEIVRRYRDLNRITALVPNQEFTEKWKSANPDWRQRWEQNNPDLVYVTKDGYQNLSHYRMQCGDIDERDILEWQILDAMTHD